MFSALSSLDGVVWARALARDTVVFFGKKINSDSTSPQPGI